MELFIMKKTLTKNSNDAFSLTKQIILRFIYFNIHKYNKFFKFTISLCIIKFCFEEFTNVKLHVAILRSFHSAILIGQKSNFRP